MRKPICTASFVLSIVGSASGPPWPTPSPCVAPRLIQLIAAATLAQAVEPTPTSDAESPTVYRVVAPTRLNTPLRARQGLITDGARHACVLNGRDAAAEQKRSGGLMLRYARADHPGHHGVASSLWDRGSRFANRRDGATELPSRLPPANPLDAADPDARVDRGSILSDLVPASPTRRDMTSTPGPGRDATDIRIGQHEPDSTLLLSLSGNLEWIRLSSHSVSSRTGEVARVSLRRRAHRAERRTSARSPASAGVRDGLPGRSS
jgi:hypothetical protein